MTVTGDSDSQGGLLVRSIKIFVLIFFALVVKLIVKFITKRDRCHYHCRCRYWFSHLLRNTYVSKFQLQSHPSTTATSLQRPLSAPPLFLDQTEARRAEKNFLGDCPPPPPPYLRVWMTARARPRPLPPYLNVWIRHWCGQVQL